MALYLPHNLAALATVAAKENPRYAVTGVRVLDPGDGTYRLEATNGRRLAIVRGSSADAPEYPEIHAAPDGAAETIIPREDWQRAFKLAKGKGCEPAVGFAASTDRFTFVSQGQVLTGAPQEGRFPNVDGVLPTRGPLVQFKVDPELLASLLPDRDPGPALGAGGSGQASLRKATGRPTACRAAHRNLWDRFRHESKNRLDMALEQEEDRNPLDQMFWWNLYGQAKHDPALTSQRWEGVKQAVLEEFPKRHRAAKTLEAQESQCWRRAQFLVFRRDPKKEWQPRNGIERRSLDTMAQGQTAYLYWLEMRTLRTTLEAEREKRQVQVPGRWQPLCVTDAEAVEQAAQMADRFNRIFRRTLRALRDLRRYTPAVLVQNAGQVNVGGSI